MRVIVLFVLHAGAIAKHCDDVAKGAGHDGNVACETASPSPSLPASSPSPVPPPRVDPCADDSSRRRTSEGPPEGAVLPPNHGFEALKMTYHEPAGPLQRIGKMISDDDPDRRRKLQSAVPTVGNAGLTTVVATTPMTGNGQGWSIQSTSLPVGTSIFGPFEAGFGAQQDGVIQQQFGCSNPSKCYSDGGWDTRLAQGACAGACGVALPRWESGRYYGFADTCGGHTNYHFHQSMNCTYTTTSGHSTKIGEGTNTAKTPLYGKYEDYPKLPDLDACGAHYGYTPDSPSTLVYHNHVQDHPPFTFGCYGPNSEGGLVSIEQCREVNAQFCGTDTSSTEDVFTDQGTFSYDAYCPCFDGSGSGYGGGGRNTFADLVEVAGVANTLACPSTPPASTPAPSASSPAPSAPSASSPSPISPGQQSSSLLDCTDLFNSNSGIGSCSPIECIFSSDADCTVPGFDYDHAAFIGALTCKSCTPATHSRGALISCADLAARLTNVGHVQAAYCNDE